MIIQKRKRNGTETTNALTNNLALDRNINSDYQKNIWNTLKQNFIVIPFFHLDFWPPGFNPWSAFGNKKRVKHIVILFFTCVYINFWD